MDLECPPGPADQSDPADLAGPGSPADPGSPVDPVGLVDQAAPRDLADQAGHTAVDKVAADKVADKVADNMDCMPFSSSIL